MLYSHKDMKSITLWQMGSFSMKVMDYMLKLIIPFIIIGLVGVLIILKKWILLTFGEEQAKASWS